MPDDELSALSEAVEQVQHRPERVDRGEEPPGLWGKIKAVLSTRRGIQIAVVGGILVLCFLVFVWPTAYRYDRLHLRGSIYPVRINRLTGKTEILCLRGWEEPTPKLAGELTPTPSGQNKPADVFPGDGRRNRSLP